MKRWFSLALALVLALGMLPAAAPAEEDPARLAVNLQAVKVMLDQNEFKYSYNEDSDSFDLKFTIDGPLKSCWAWMIVYDDGVLIQADYDVTATSDVRDEMAAYFIRVSNDTRLGAFYMDYSTGDMGYELFLYSDVVAPTQDALHYGLLLAVGMVEEYSAAVAGILFNGLTAEQAYALEE